MSKPMKYCKKCKVSYPDSYNHCPRCGAKLTEDLYGNLFTEKDKDFFKLGRLI